MKYHNAYIMLTKNTKTHECSNKNMQKRWVFKCCLKRGVDIISLICCGMMFHAFGDVTPKRLAEKLKIEYRICNLVVSCDDRRVREGLGSDMQFLRYSGAELVMILWMWRHNLNWICWGIGSQKYTYIEKYNQIQSRIRNIEQMSF